ncbi:MAG: NAD(P)-dependent oxidoreductase [Roseiflexaceae bacterium]|nr:NAD(P)-dependent oxidoreductase [Roseiflexaceae bacterium]
MRIAVTGGNGRLGRALVPYLIDQGHTVVSIDRTLPEMTWPSSANQPIFQVADTRNVGEFVACLRGCDALIHLAAFAGPNNHPDTVVYADNTIGSYNALSAAAMLGIDRVCLASSINAIGGVYSRSPRYDYFPLNEQHPTYAEDPYSLSKWVLEQQADAFARRYETMTIASMRFHWLIASEEEAQKNTAAAGAVAARHLWGFTLMGEACRACLLALAAPFSGHEVFYIVAPRTALNQPSRELAEHSYPETPIQGEFTERAGFFDCSKAERILGWKHA